MIDMIGNGNGWIPVFLGGNPFSQGTLPSIFDVVSKRDAFVFVF